MPIPVDGLVEITIEGTLLGVNYANIFYYWDSSDDPISDMPEIATQFNNFVPNQLAVGTTTDITYDNIRVRDVLGLVPDYEQPPSDPNGNIVDDVLPAFNAVRFDYAVQTKETRRGYKRFAGVPEGSISDGVLTPAALATWEAIALSCLQPLPAGGNSYQPMVYGKAIPSDPARSVVNIVTSIVARPRITSQVSRK